MLWLVRAELAPETRSFSSTVAARLHSSAGARFAYASSLAYNCRWTLTNSWSLPGCFKEASRAVSRVSDGPLQRPADSENLFLSHFRCTLLSALGNPRAWILHQASSPFNICPGSHLDEWSVDKLTAKFVPPHLATACKFLGRELHGADIGNSAKTLWSTMLVVEGSLTARVYLEGILFSDRMAVMDEYLLGWFPTTHDFD